MSNHSFALDIILKSSKNQSGMLGTMSFRVFSGLDTAECANHENFFPHFCRNLRQKALEWNSGTFRSAIFLTSPLGIKYQWTRVNHGMYVDFNDDKTPRTTKISLNFFLDTETSR